MLHLRSQLKRPAQEQEGMEQSGPAPDQTKKKRNARQRKRQRQQREAERSSEEREANGEEDVVVGEDEARTGGMVEVQESDDEESKDGGGELLVLFRIIFSRKWTVGFLRVKVVSKIFFFLVRKLNE